MKKVFFVLTTAVFLTTGIQVTAQRRHKPAPHPAHGVTTLKHAPAGPKAPVITVPKEKGRTVISEQVSNSGNVIPTPVPPPKKVVIVPAPPPPGGTTITAPPKR